MYITDDFATEHSTKKELKDKSIFTGTQETSTFPKKSNIQSILSNEENESPSRGPRRRASPRTPQDRDSGQGQSTTSSRPSSAAQKSGTSGRLTSSYTARNQLADDDQLQDSAYPKHNGNQQDLMSFVSADKFNFSAGKGPSKDRSSQFVEWKDQLVSAQYDKGGESVETPRSGQSSVGAAPPTSPYSAVLLSSLPDDSAPQQPTGPDLDDSRQRTPPMQDGYAQQGRVRHYSVHTDPSVRAPDGSMAKCKRDVTPVR